MKNGKYLTIPQAAGILGISRTAVYKKVKKGQIKAIRIGRNFAIPKSAIINTLGRDLTGPAKKQITAAVRKTVREYADVLKLLGGE
jgi:excisionase family DNA binding protein